MRYAPNQMNPPNAAAMSAGGRLLAICGPISEPTTMPGAIAPTTDHSTAPLA